MVLNKTNIRKIEWHLYKYNDFKKYIYNMRENIIYTSNNVYGESTSKPNTHSDPTALKAMKLLEVSEEEQWVNIINKVRKKLREENLNLEKFLVKKYFKNYTMIQIMMELNIERTTAYRWREEIILNVAILAIQEGLIKI